MNIGIIPARGGSKGIIGKNLKKVGGISLVGRAVAAAVRSKLDKVYVYSDEEAILELGRQGGAIAQNRPAAVSGDHTTSEETICSFLEEARISKDTGVMLLQCTTPFMKVEYINQAVGLYSQGNYDSVISVVACDRYLGYLGSKFNKGCWVPMYPYRWLRQEHSTLFYMENGGFYLTDSGIWRSSRRFGRKCAVVTMEWWESIEIDSVDDLEVANAIVPIALR
jgi:N-acylneuraminate cytidylyltransferase